MIGVLYDMRASQAGISRQPGHPCRMHADQLRHYGLVGHPGMIRRLSQGSRLRRLYVRWRKALADEAAGLSPWRASTYLTAIADALDTTSSPAPAASATSQPVPRKDTP